MKYELSIVIRKKFVGLSLKNDPYLNDDDKEAKQA